MRHYPKRSRLVLQSFFFVFIFLSFMVGSMGEISAAPACPPFNWDDNSLPPPEHWAVVKRLSRYYHSDEYMRDVKIKVKEAIAILERAITESHGTKKLAIVLDIDETVLASNEAMEKLRYGYYEPYFEEEFKKASLPAIRPMLDVVKFAKEHSITIFYITGRKKILQEATEKNLKEQGFDYFETIFYKPADYHEKSIASYKSGVRKQIESQGFEIVLSVGDQESDFKGGYAAQFVKLPNYIYFIP